LGPLETKVLRGLILALAMPGPAFALEQPAPWQKTMEKIASERDGLSLRLAETLKVLHKRVEAERPDLLPKLSTEPPKALPVGYGILPKLEPDGPEVDPAKDRPSERMYAFEPLSEWLSREQGYEVRLSSDVLHKGRTLDALVDDYLLRAENFRRIDQHVKYHALWQNEIRRDPKAFDKANGLFADYRVWRSSSAEESARARARERLKDEWVSFSSVPWHHIEKSQNGSLVLKLPLMTDIEDEVFLSTLAAGVERDWNDSAAMRQARLRIEIVLKRRSPASLYPEGPPAHGAKIDLPKHLGRFGPGYLLTTGGDYLHVLGGRAIVLGPAPIPCRAVAHELSHLLGFKDGYIRAFEGSPEASNGVVIHEVTPFAGDLLANPGAGRITEAMVRRLIEAYLKP